MPKKITLAEAKAMLKEAKAKSRIEKKRVSDAMKAFIEQPTQPMGKAYREATSAHIKAVVAEYNANMRVNDLLAL